MKTPYTVIFDFRLLFTVPVFFKKLLFLKAALYTRWPRKDPITPKTLIPASHKHHHLQDHIFGLAFQRKQLSLFLFATPIKYSRATAITTLAPERHSVFAVIHDTDADILQEPWQSLSNTQHPCSTTLELWGIVTEHCNSVQATTHAVLVSSKA